MKRSEKGEKTQHENVEEDNQLDGMAGDILRGIGNIIPGLGGLVKGLEKTDVFRERLKAIDEEVVRRFKGRPIGERRGTPQAQAGFTSRPVIKRRSVPREETGISEAKRPEEYRVDVFDEGDHLRIVAELPGMEEKGIKAKLTGSKLIISADMADGNYRREVKLPCAPKGELEKAYRNGILEIKVQKIDGIDNSE